MFRLNESTAATREAQFAEVHHPRVGPHRARRTGGNEIKVPGWVGGVVPLVEVEDAHWVGLRGKGAGAPAAARGRGALREGGGMGGDGG
jgi:hypothetical protein